MIDLLDGPVAIAHRGSRLLWPENTMVAFQGAVSLGFRWLETDLHLASDGEVMCIHDDTVDRTTDGTGPVASLTRRELERLDAGRAMTGFEGAGHGVPGLDEVLLSFPDVNLVVDLKQDRLEKPLLALLRRLGAADRVVVGSFSDRRLRRLRRIGGGNVLTSAGPLAVGVVRLLSTVGRVPRVADALQIPERIGIVRLVDPRLVAGAKAAGMAVHVWTVNQPEDMHRLLEWGVTGIVTDRPDLLKQVMIEREVWR